MRETQILRGLHKARAKMAAQQVRHYAGGTPYVGNALESMGGNDIGAALAAAGARGDAQALQGAFQQNGGTWQGTTAAQDSAAAAAGNARGLRPTPFVAPFAIQKFAKGAPIVNGQAGIDKVPAMLTKGEAVLPVKTVQKVGPANIARLIAQTAGEAPAKGLRAGGKYSIGETPWNQTTGAAPGVMVGGKAPLPEVELNPNGAAASNAANGWNSARPTVAGTTTAAPSMAPDIDFSATKPAAPAPQGIAQTIKSRAGAAYDAVRGNAPGTTGTAAPAPLTPPPTGMDGVRALQKSMNPDMSGKLMGGVKTGVNAVNKLAGGAAKMVRPAAIAMDAGNVADVALDPNMTKTDVGTEVASKVGKWGAATAGAALAAPYGALAGPFAPAAIPLMGLAGGAAGYFGADKLMRAGRGAVGTETSDPSDRSNGPINQALYGDRSVKPVAAAPAPAPYNPNQTAETAQRTGLRLGVNSAVSNGAQGGRGVMGTSPNGTTITDPNSRDYSAELASLPSTMPSGLREGVIHKTVGKNGETVYSGINVAPGADGQTQMVDGTGRTVQSRGSLRYADHNNPVGMAPGGFAFTPSNGGGNPAAGQSQSGLAAGQSWNPQVAAAVRAAIERGDTDAASRALNGGAAPGQPAQGGGLGPAQQALQAALAGSGGMMTKSKLAALTQAADTEVRGQGNRMQADVGHESNAVADRGHTLQNQGVLARIQHDRNVWQQQLGQEAMKTMDADNLKSTFAAAPDDKGNLVPNQVKANQLGQFLNAAQWRTPDGKTGLNLNHLSAMDPQAYKQHRMAAETQFGMGQKLNEGGDTLFGQQNGWAPPEITGVREGRASDIVQGGRVLRSLANATGLMPGSYGKVIDFNVNGVKQTRQLSDFINDPTNGGQYKAYIQAWQKEHGQAPLGADLTSGK